MASVAVVAAIGLFEFNRGMSNFGRRPLWLAGYLVMACFFMLNTWWAAGLLGVASLLLMLIFMVFTYPRYHIVDLALTYFGSVYIGLLLGYLARLSQLDNHFGVIVLVLFLTWACDAGAYFAGTMFGKHKMAPELSPNKTWEGFAGGFAAAILISVVGGLILQGISIGQYIVLGILAGLAAPLGDLFASSIKRGFGIKDFGKLFPGHGGVLDRVDSLMCVAPVVYFLISRWGG